MRIKSLGLLGFSLFLWLLRAPAEEGPQKPSIETLVYEGTITWIDHKQGEFIVIGNREDRSEDVIVKLKTDPRDVYVTDARNQVLEFSDLSRGDSVMVDCIRKGDELIVDSIIVYSYKEI